MAQYSETCVQGDLYDFSTKTCVTCAEGHYCPNAFIEQPCPVSQWSLRGSSSHSNCSFSLCPPGYTCSLGEKQLCSPGMWRKGMELECSFCDYGFACHNGTKTVCDHDVLYPLGLGYGQTVCGVCPASKYVLRDAESSMCVLCPLGSSCPGNGNRTKCEGNRYADDSGFSQCSICTNGYTLNTGIVCNECPPTYDCSDGIQTFRCNVSNVNCTLCPIGFKPRMQERSVQCLLCSEGKYCDGRLEYDCPDGMTSPSGTTAEEYCIECPPGKRCYHGFSESCNGTTFSRGTHRIVCSVRRDTTHCPHQ